MHFRVPAGDETGSFVKVSSAFIGLKNPNGHDAVVGRPQLIESRQPQPPPDSLSHIFRKQIDRCDLARGRRGVCVTARVCVDQADSAGSPICQVRRGDGFIVKQHLPSQSTSVHAQGVQISIRHQTPVGPLPGPDMYVGHLLDIVDGGRFNPQLQHLRSLPNPSAPIKGTADGTEQFPGLRIAVGKAFLHEGSCGAFPRPDRDHARRRQPATPDPRFFVLAFALSWLPWSP